MLQMECQSHPNLNQSVKQFFICFGVFIVYIRYFEFLFTNRSLFKTRLLMRLLYSSDYLRKDACAILTTSNSNSMMDHFYLAKFLFCLVCIFLFSLSSNPVYAQEPVAVVKPSIDLTPLETGSVVTQFDFVLEKSSKFEDTRVVKTFWLIRLKAHVTDTLRTMNRKFAEIQKTVTKKQSEIDSLKTGITAVSAGLSVATSEKNSMKLFGLFINKSLYQTVVWLVIIGLSLIVLIVAVLFKRSNSITVQTKTDLEELREEFDAHRKRALEREAQLSRKHLDELNKLKK